jgi:hypothetical protein
MTAMAWGSGIGIVVMKGRDALQQLNEGSGSGLSAANTCFEEST